MGNLLFSPSGRIGPSPYMKGMIILGVIAAIINLLPLISVGLAVAVSVLALVLIIPFIFLGIKRSHDAGKSGWMVLTHILLFFGVSFALGLLLQAIGLGAAQVDETAINAAAESGDISGVLELAGEAAKAAAIPGAITSLIAYGVSAFLVNMFNPHDASTNQYGTNVTDTFS